MLRKQCSSLVLPFNFFVSKKINHAFKVHSSLLFFNSSHALLALLLLRDNGSVHFANHRTKSLDLGVDFHNKALEVLGSLFAL